MAEKRAEGQAPPLDSARILGYNALKPNRWIGRAAGYADPRQRATVYRQACGYAGLAIFL